MTTKVKYTESEAIAKEEFKKKIADMNDRDKALLSLLWLTGLRISEALALKPVNLTYEDVLGHKFVYVKAMTLKRARLKPRTKKYREKHPAALKRDLKNKAKQRIPMRLIPIDLERDGDLWENVEKYLQLREPFEKIFKIGRWSAWNIVKKHGLGKTHNLRHSFTTECFRRGLSLPQVQDLCGWKSVKMFDVYRHEFRVQDVARSLLLLKQQDEQLRGSNNG